MIKSLTRLPFLLFILFTVGCSNLKQLPYNSGMNQHVKTIAIIKPNEPAQKQIYYYNHPGLQLGLIGAIAMDVEFASKRDDFSESIKEHDFKAGEIFINTLKTELELLDYKIEIVERPKDSSGFLDSYPANEKPVDAYLDFYYTSFGYLAGGPASDYKASTRLAVQLVDSKTNATLYSDHLSIGESFGTSNEFSYLGFEEDYTFPDFDQLISSPYKSIEGLKKTNEQVAQFIAEQFIPKARKQARAKKLQLSAEQP